MRPVVLSIAGSDPSGGAGVQADLKTMHGHGVYGAAVVTLLTVQNTRGCHRVSPVETELVLAQTQAVLDDLPVAAVKLGALGTADTATALLPMVCKAAVPIILDPVRLATRGEALLEGGDDAAQAMRAWVPHCALITPNLPEARWLLGTREGDPAVLLDALAALGTSVLLKAGHGDGSRAVDRLHHQGSDHRFDRPRIVTRAGHGTGCALASSIASHLALGRSIPDAVRRAGDWVHRGLRDAPELGDGSAPIDLFQPVDHE